MLSTFTNYDELLAFVQMNIRQVSDMPTGLS